VWDNADGLYARCPRFVGGRTSVAEPSPVGQQEQAAAGLSQREVGVHNDGVARGDAALREALGKFLSGPRRAPPVRAEILDSWRRAASSGLEPGPLDPTYEPDVEQGSRLELAATPVLDQLADDLAGTGCEHCSLLA
jgi:hypothetical protein